VLTYLSRYISKAGATNITLPDYRQFGIVDGNSDSIMPITTYKFSSNVLLTFTP